MTDDVTLAGRTSTVYTPDSLIAGNAELLLDESITLISGQNLTRGSLLGKITASGKYTLSLSASGDGSQTPVAVLAHTTDASGGDAVTNAYVRGDFNQNAVTFGTGHTAASTKEALRALGIALVPSVAA